MRKISYEGDIFMVNIAEDNLLSLRENRELELKKAETALPRTIWETYSSFANTHGGTIILGIEETSEGSKVSGVQAEYIDKILDDLWNILSNPQKVSHNLLSDSDVRVETFEGKQIIFINVPEASLNLKPIYLNGNPKNTYIRKHGGDYRATDAELASLFRNSRADQDNTLLNGYTIDDLDISSIENYRNRIYERSGNEDILTMPIQDFLINTGAMQIDRQDNRIYKLTEGGLLFLGKYQSIISYFPHFHLDYFDKRGEVDRWKDRVCSGDFSYPNLNLLSYYLIVSEKLKATVEEPFELDENLIRRSSSHMREALREALVNMIIHADYHDNTTSLNISVYDTHYTFINPGCLNITIEEFLRGGISRPRNNVLNTLFRRAGISERAGTGGPKILNAAIKNRFKHPKIESDVSQTQLTIWNVDSAYSPEIESLNEDEKAVFEIFVEVEGAISTNQLLDKTDLGRYKIGKALKALMDKNLIYKKGAGPSTRYCRMPNPLEFYASMSDFIKQIPVLFRNKSETKE